MSRPTVTITCRRVSASAEIRHVITAVVPTAKSVAVTVGARRGPVGPVGPAGPVGPPGDLENIGTVVFSGGHF